MITNAVGAICETYMLENERNKYKDDLRHTHTHTFVRTDGAVLSCFILFFALPCLFTERAVFVTLSVGGFLSMKSSQKVDVLGREKSWFS